MHWRAHLTCLYRFRHVIAKTDESGKESMTHNLKTKKNKKTCISFWKIEVIQETICIRLHHVPTQRTMATIS